MDAVDVATVKFFYVDPTTSTETEIKGTATEETIGHKWEAMTIRSIEEGYEKTGFTVKMYDKADYSGTPVELTNAQAIIDNDTIVVKQYIKVYVTKTANYDVATLNETAINNTTGMAITVGGNTITVTVNYGLSELKAALEAAATVPGATVEVYSAKDAVADTGWTAGTTGWYIVVTALDGTHTATYYLA